MYFNTKNYLKNNCNYTRLQNTLLITMIKTICNREISRKSCRNLLFHIALKLGLCFHIT